MVDLFTGCFEGGVYVLPGKKAGGFAEPQKLLDRAGRILRLGQFWNYETKKWDGVADSKYAQELGIGADAVDWDGDGDLDLVIGSSHGHLFLRTNEGTKEKAAFATDSVEILGGGAPLRIGGGECIPSVVDWDGDGRFDLVSGSGAGGVWWVRNVGRAGAPAFEEPRALVEPEPFERGTLRDPSWPGRGTQACVTDFDEDSDLDVLVGDINEEDSKSTAPRERHGWVWLFRHRGPDAKGTATGDPAGKK